MKLFCDRKIQSDAALIDGYRRGRMADFELLYERHSGALYGFLRHRFADSAALWDDIFQLSWLRALEALDRYENQEKFSAWLFRIARNQGIDLLRRRNRRELYEQEMPPEELEAVATATPDRLTPMEFDEVMTRTLAMLPAAQREVVALRLENWSFKAIAAWQDAPVSTVTARMSYALKKLGAEVKKDE